MAAALATQQSHHPTRFNKLHHENSFTTTSANGMHRTTTTTTTPSYYPSSNETANDDLTFGNFCLNCDNEAPSDSPYCSEACRLDSEHESAPDSPSALPALVPSTSKSTCSTPPSSATNSPSPRGMISDAALNDEPPRLDIGAPLSTNKFYGGQSLPIKMRYPVSNAWKGAFPDIADNSHHHHHHHHPDAFDLTKNNLTTHPSDLQFRRRASKPRTPAPLFYREKAAFVRSSPAMGPTSPSKPTFWSPQLTATSDIPALGLPPLSSLAASSSAALPPPVVRTKNCGRPGCVGEVRRSRLGNSKKERSAGSGEATRRPSRTLYSSSSALKHPASSHDSPASNDLLMSPRIRALRATEPNLSAIDDALEELSMSRLESYDELSSSSSSDEEANHSAFACYLFSHLSEEKKKAISQAKEDRSDDGDDEVEGVSARGRTAAPPTSAVIERRFSVDTASVANHTSPAPAPNAARPTRFLFNRGSANIATPTESDDEPTVRGRAKTSRPKLEPGHFIPATTDSPSDSPAPSAFAPSPCVPASPPTRGRSVARRPSVSESDVLGDLPITEGRGRSHMRGAGAVLRSVSPSTRESSESNSRSRRSSSNRTRDSASGRRDSRAGRASRVDSVNEGIEDADEDRRGRGRGRSSSLRRMREIIISGAAYGHGSP